MKAVYVGAHDVVEIPESGHVATRNGDPIEVSADLGARLLEQPDNWQPVETDAQRAKREQAAKDKAEQDAAAAKAAADAVKQVKAEQAAARQGGSTS